MTLKLKTLISQDIVTILIENDLVELMQNELNRLEETTSLETAQRSYNNLAESVSAH